MTKTKAGVLGLCLYVWKETLGYHDMDTINTPYGNSAPSDFNGMLQGFFSQKNYTSTCTLGRFVATNLSNNEN